MRQINLQADLVSNGDLAFNLGTSTIRYFKVFAFQFVGSIVAPSDETLKESIVSTTRSGLSDIDALRVVDYTWKSTGKRDTGLIAQEAKEVNPNFVVEIDGLYHVAQYPLIVSLIKAVQELSAEVKLLRGGFTPLPPPI